jgi:hypothetical protein
MLILLYIHKSKPQQGHLASHCQVGPGDLSLVRLVADTVPGGGEAGAGLLGCWSFRTGHHDFTMICDRKMESWLVWFWRICQKHEHWSYS